MDGEFLPVGWICCERRKGGVSISIGSELDDGGAGGGGGGDEQEEEEEEDEDDVEQRDDGDTTRAAVFWFDRRFLMPNFRLQAFGSPKANLRCREAIMACCCLRVSKVDNKTGEKG